MNNMFQRVFDPRRGIHSASVPNPKSKIQNPKPLTVVLALGLVAIRPILTSTLPCTDDAAFHLLRLTQLDHLLRQGVVYSRWAPAMAWEYGFPFFNFYAPLSYYGAAVVSAAGLGLNLGLRVTFALGILASGLAMYRLARDHFSHTAALVAAVAYMYAPYQAYDVLFRGNLAESAAWPLLPLALWTMGRLARGGGRGWLAGAAVSYAAVLLTHNVFALIFSPLLLAYGLIEAAGMRGLGEESILDFRFWILESSRSLPKSKIPNPKSPNPLIPAILRVVAALVLGLGLAAFFWLPAMAERGYIHSDRLLVPPVFVYWNNFLSPAETIAPPQTIHPDLINPSPPRALGLVPMLLGLPGLAGLFIWRGGRRRQVAFFGLALLVYVLMMTAASRPLWDHLPLLEFVQFPWRLLGPAALCLALLVAATIEWMNDGSVHHSSFIIHRFLPVAAITTLILADLFWLDPRYCPGLERPTVADIQTFEQATDTIGTTAKGEYLPRTVVLFPERPARPPFAQETLPAGVTVLEQEPRPVGEAAWLETTQAQTITVDIFAYPGWQVAVDGSAVPITPSPDYGLITFPLPPGRHHVSLTFSETPLRLAADGVSAVTLLVVLAFVMRNAYGVMRKRITHDELQITPPPPRFPFPVSRFPFHALGLALFLLITFVLPRTNSPLRRPGLQNGALPGLSNPLPAEFEGGLSLLGFERSGETMAAGEPLRLDLFWLTRQTPAAAYQSVIHLIGSDGQEWSPKSTTLPRDFRAPPPTTLWPAGHYAQDSHLLTPLPGAPPGDYTLRLTLFDKATLAALPVQAAGSLALDLGLVTLRRPAHPPLLAELDRQYVVEVDGSPVRLVGYNLGRPEAAPGDPFTLTVFWQAEEKPTADLVARLTLLDPDDNEALSLDLPPARADFPTTLWQAGEVWRGQHVFRLPAGLTSGVYHWQLQLCRPESPVGGDWGIRGFLWIQSPNPLIPANCESPADLGALQINAPERLWQAPTPDVALGVDLGHVATLLGVTLRPNPPRPGEPLAVTLIWRAESETAVSYRVFLHLVGPDGEIVSQSDGEPADWTRPTTGWLPGEIVLDERVLEMPPEQSLAGYSLRAGLYDPATGERLETPEGETAATLLLR
ncbi:MAG: glycosyltransferase family 39 protein [Chloroflexota bacterium]